MYDGSLDVGRDVAPGLSPTGAVLRILELGTFVDPGTASVQRLDEDAERVHAVVRLSPARALLVNYARLRGRPDWRPGAVPRVVGDFEVTASGRRRAKIIYASGRPSYCLVKEVESPASIEAARRRYRDWHVALAWVQAVLRGVPLRRFAVSETLPPFSPWQDARPVPRILPVEARV